VRRARPNGSKRPRSLDLVLVTLGIALVVAAATVALTRGGSDDGAAPDGSTDSNSAADAARAVTIRGFKFLPPSVTVKAGSSLTWVNEDSAAHTATSDRGGLFDTGTIAKGQRKAVTFKRRGEFTYHCDFHPFMKAVVRVSR
jgi:plastocyanin